MFGKMNSKKGFTLIELLVVIAIIGILAVVAVPALFKNIGKAKVADATSDYNAIRSSVLAIYAEDNDLVYETLKYNGKVTDYLEKTLETTPFGGQYYIVPTKFKDDKGEYHEYNFPAYEINKDGSIGDKSKGTGNMFEITLAIRPEGWDSAGKPYGMPKITKEQLLKLAKDIGYDRVFLGTPQILESGNEIFIGLIPKK